jgi:hypothetical protein
MDRAYELLHLLWRRLDLREVAGELVDRHGLLVPGALVAGHRVVVRAVPREGVVES